MNELRIAKDRLLRMCARLTEGEVLYKEEEAARYGCSARSGTLADQGALSYYRCHSYLYGGTVDPSARRLGEVFAYARLVCAD